MVRKSFTISIDYIENPTTNSKYPNSTSSLAGTFIFSDDASNTNNWNSSIEQNSSLELKPLDIIMNTNPINIEILEKISIIAPTSLAS